jgi:hypothetical protein
LLPNSGSCGEGGGGGHITGGDRLNKKKVNIHSENFLFSFVNTFLITEPNKGKFSKTL